MHTHFTPDKIDELYFNQKMSWQKIADFCGCKDKSCVYQWRKRQNKKIIHTPIHKNMPVVKAGAHQNQVLELTKEEKKIVKIVERHNYKALFKEIPDTRSWTWAMWTKKFLRYDLIHQQEEWLESMNHQPTQLIASRQIGKTTVLQIFVLRKLCESVFDYLYGFDRSILYVSHDFEILKKMFTFLRSNLLTNRQVIEWYGLLINREKVEGLSEAIQNGYQIRLKSLINPYLVSFNVSTPLANVRGDEYYYIIIDDTIDVKKAIKKPAEVMKLTEAIEHWINYDLSPTIKGHVILSGTRYNVNDIYARAMAKKLYKGFTLPLYSGSLPAFHMLEIDSDEVISPLHFIIDTPQDKISLRCNAEYLWSPNGKFKGAFEYQGTIEQNILYKLWKLGEVAFKQEYLCIPTVFDNQLNFDNLGLYSALPADPYDMTWVIFIDPASGLSDDANVTSIAMVGERDGKYYIHKLRHGHWDALDKQQEVLAFYDQALLETRKKKISIYDENVRNQDFHNRLNRETKLQTNGYNPKDDHRGEKDQRIADNFGLDLKNHLLNLNLLISQSDRAKLSEEMVNFGNIHADVLDAIDQALYILRNKYVKKIANRIYS